MPKNKRKGNMDTVIIGAYYDDQKRLRPITASKYASSRGVPARVKGAKLKSGEAPIHVVMDKGMHMDDMITIDGVSKSRRAWLTDLSLYAEPVYLNSDMGWRPDHNRSDVIHIDLNTGENVRQFQKGKTPGWGDIRKKAKIPDKPRDVSKATLKRFKNEVGIDQYSSYDLLKEQGTLPSADVFMGVIVDKKKAKKSIKAVEGDETFLLSDKIAFKDLKKGDSATKGEAYLIDNVWIDPTFMEKAIRILGGKGDIIVRTHSEKDHPIVLENNQGDQVTIAPFIGGPDSKKEREKARKRFIKLKGITDLTLYKKHKLPSKKARESGMERMIERGSANLILYDKQGTFGYREAEKMKKRFNIQFKENHAELIPDPGNKKKPKSRHRYWLYVDEEKVYVDRMGKDIKYIIRGRRRG